MIINVFNSVYDCVFAFFVLLTIFLCIFLKKKGLEFSRKFLIFTYFGAIILFIVYKWFIVNDVAYCNELGYVRPFILNELPFQACNVFLFVLPFALIWNKKHLVSCIAFFSVLTGTLALVMPSKGMTGVSLLTPRVWGYFITHYLVFMETPLLICSGLYKPKYKDIPASVLTLLGFAALGFVISLILVWTNLNPIANYFFSMNPDNPVLKIFYNLIPVKGLYLLPTSVLAFAWAVLVTLIYNLCSKKNQAK